jgi:hypothetical protein
MYIFYKFSTTPIVLYDMYAKITVNNKFLETNFVEFLVRNS